MKQVRRPRRRVSKPKKPGIYRTFSTTGNAASVGPALGPRLTRSASGSRHHWSAAPKRSTRSTASGRDAQLTVCRRHERKDVHALSAAHEAQVIWGVARALAFMN
jgi:hypothetical protein